MNFPFRRLRPKGPPPQSARQQALAAWRGVDISPVDVARADRAQTAGALMPRVLSGLRLDNRRSEAEIARVWNNLMDPNIVAHAQPVGLHKGTLFVNVDSSAWLAEIVRYRRREILERLQHSFGCEMIVRISFRAG